MDQFFAAIAILDDPSLKGKPVLVGGTGNRGVVTTASYEARVYGCGSAMPMSTARRLCPHAVCVKVPGRRIKQCSRAVFDILHRFSPKVQPLSVDEAFLDCTGQEGVADVGGDGPTIARKIRAAVLGETGLTASVGVAPNKFLAKLASDLDKPDGLTVITPENLRATLDPLPVRRLWGVGPAMEAKLHARGVQTVADLRALGFDVLQRRFGDMGARLYRLSRGIDDRPVTTDRQAKSIGQEQTFGSNLTHPDDVRGYLLQQCEEVGARLRRHGATAAGVTVKIRFGNFQTVTRAGLVEPATDLSAELYAVALRLFDHWAETAWSPVRLVGVTAQKLRWGPQQMPLFGRPERERSKQVDAALDTLADRFGPGTVRRFGA